jgi:hypothetical protein
LVLLPFDPDTYGPRVAGIFAEDSLGAQAGNVRDLLLKADARDLFPGARDPQCAIAGLFLYFSYLTEAHELLHHFATVDGEYWHGIMHRMEGDSYNAGYWFRRVGRHPVFPALHREAGLLGYPQGREWDPFAFIEFCEASAKAKDDDLAKRVQLAEWQLLFDYCATPVTSRTATR